MSDEVTYNGYTFGPRTHISVTAEMVEDGAQRTIVYHRYKLKVQTIICAEPGDSDVGQHFQRIRQLLSKAGQTLIIDHDGFGPALNINLSTQVKDVNFGPKPRFLSWEPVGHTNAVEVVWECEFCLPTCNGQSDVRHFGLAELNYGVSYRINKHGYTTRTVSGYLVIAMTRTGDTIPDTADRYRDLIVVDKPIDYERETTWNLSQDKRRADFTLTDSQIESPNAYPPGVISIRANHRVGWSRRQAATLRNTINATIELAHDQPRGMAWQIFKAIVQQRTAFADSGSYGDYVMLEALEVDEELYGHAIHFSCQYRLIPGESAQGALSRFFTSTGLMSNLTTWQDWAYWSESIKKFQSHRGMSGLTHAPEQDQIVDLCSSAFNPQVTPPYFVPGTVPTAYVPLCNPKPPPTKSYVRFEASLESIEDNPSTEQISIGTDDRQPLEFDPSQPLPLNGETDSQAEITRFVEEAPAGLRFRWMGYCERLGYDIPKPGKLTFGGTNLIRHGKGRFRKKYLGKFFCQPLYAAVWDLEFIVDRRPTAVSADEADPINTEAT